MFHRFVKIPGGGVTQMTWWGNGDNNVNTFSTVGHPQSPRCYMTQAQTFPSFSYYQLPPGIGPVLVAQHISLH